MTPSLTERLTRADEEIPQQDIAAQRATIATLPAAALEDLERAIGTYQEKKAAYLTNNATTATELLALKGAVRDRRNATRSTPERAGAEWGAQAGAMIDQTVDRATALGYREWLKLQDPTETTGMKILRVTGLALSAYGLYRVARWVVGKKDDSGLGRLFKALGVSAAAAWAINVLGADAEARAPQTERAPDVLPTVPGLSLTVRGTRVDIVERQNAGAAERLLRVGSHLYRAPAIGLIRTIAQEGKETRFEAQSLPFITGPTAYLEQQELERMIGILKNGATVDVTITYFDKPSTDPKRTPRSRAVRFERI